MAMGKRKRQAKQASMWVATQDLPRSAAHPFYTRLNQILYEHGFEGYVEGTSPSRTGFHHLLLDLGPDLCPDFCLLPFDLTISSTVQTPAAGR